MLEELGQTKRQLEQIKEIVEKTKFFEIEKIDISRIENPLEVERTIDLLFEIRNLSTFLIKPFSSIQRQSIDTRGEAERHLNSLNQKALHKEEPFFLL